MGEERKIQLIRIGLGTLVGAVTGTIDCVTTGLPILTVGAPIWGTMRFLDYQWNCEKYGMGRWVKTSKGLVDCARGCIPHIVGASIPFAIRYHNELYNLVKNL